MNVNVFDILLVALPLVFLLLGFLHTGWREFLSLVGVLLGTVVGVLYGTRLADVIARALPERDLAQVIGFLVLVAGGWTLGGLLGSVAERLQTGSRSESNRVLPALFGVLKGGVLDLALVWVVDRYIPAFQTALRNATLAGYANEAISFLTHHNPL